MVISDTFQNFANDKIVKCEHPIRKCQYNLHNYRKHF